MVINSTHVSFPIISSCHVVTWIAFILFFLFNFITQIFFNVTLYMEEVSCKIISILHFRPPKRPAEEPGPIRFLACVVEQT